MQGLATSAIDARASQLAASNRAVGRIDVFTTYNYGNGTRARDAWRPKFKYTAQVITAGADAHVSDGFLAGAAFNVGRLSADVSAARGDFTVEDGAGRLYAIWRGGPVSLLMDANYGTLTVKGIHRATAFGGFRTNGKTGGEHWGAGIKAAWGLELGTATLRPWFGLRTERVTLDGYTEKDVPALSMQFEEQEAASTSGAIGVDFAKNWKLGSRSARLELRGAWHDEIGSSTRDVAGKLADNFTRTTTATLEDGDGSGLELGGAVTLFFHKNWSASLGYAADIRSGEKLANRATLSLQTGF